MTFTSFDKRMFKLARAVAESSSFKNFHLGCVVTYKKHVLSVGVNSNKTHPAQKKYNRKHRKFTKTDKPMVDSVHAEIDALSKISYPIEQNISWKDVKVYIYRISNGRKDGHGLARPCPACMAALKNKGIRHIYFTTNEGYGYERLD